MNPADVVQQMPEKNDRPAIQDLVIASLRDLPTVYDDVTRNAVIADIEARKAIGLVKYGTLLQAFNGRDALVDAYQEALDLTQYLRQAVEEGQTELADSFEGALDMALDLRYLIWVRDRDKNTAAPSPAGPSGLRT